MEYPIDIQNFQDTISSICGVTSIESGICPLEDVDSELLKTPDYAHLPIAALLRTNGGFKDELLAQFRFNIEKTEQGLEALEFLAWFIRDCSRANVKIQLTPFALPPASPFKKQLGETLRFHIDLFVDDITDSLEPVFNEIKNITDSLNLAIKLYDIKVKS